MAEAVCSCVVGVVVAVLAVEASLNAFSEVSLHPIVARFDVPNLMFAHLSKTTYCQSWLRSNH